MAKERRREATRPDLANRVKNPIVSMGHRRLARITAEFGGLPGMTKSKLAKMAGLKSPTPFNAPGFKVALAEFGLTEGFVAEALVKDIQKKPQNRYHELTLAADILGMRKQGSNVDNSRNLTLIVSGQTAQRFSALQEKVPEIVNEPDPEPTPKPEGV